MELTENSPSGLGLVVENILYYCAKPVSISHTFCVSETSSFTLSIEIPEKILIGENPEPEDWHAEKEVEGGVEKTRRVSNHKNPFFCRKRLVLKAPAIERRSLSKEFPDFEFQLVVMINERRIKICAFKYIKSKRKIHIVRFERFSRYKDTLTNPKYKTVTKGKFEIVILFRRPLTRKNVRESEIAKLIDHEAFFDD